MTAAGDRLLEQADQCELKALHHTEQATVGTQAERTVHERAAHDFRVIEATLRLVAQALDNDDD